MKQKIKIHTVMLSIIIVLLSVIIVSKSPEQQVNAQGDGFARNVFGLIGKKQGNREPLYLVDTQEQVIMVYEYSVQGQGLGLISVRSYKYDKQLEEFGTLYGDNVEKIKAYLLKHKK